MKSLSKTVTISHFATTFNNFALKIERMVNPLNVSVASIETSQLICKANQLTSFYMRATLVFEWLAHFEN